MFETLDFSVLAAGVLEGTTMTEVLIGASAMIISAVFGSVYSAWAGKKTQLTLLEKQIELNKEMHKQLLEEQQEFVRQMEQDRRQYDKSQEMHREARQRAQDLTKEARQNPPGSSSGL